VKIALDADGVLLDFSTVCEGAIPNRPGAGAAGDCGVGGMTLRKEQGHRVCEHGPVIGWYRGCEIFSFLRYANGDYGEFAGIAPEGKDGAIVLADVLNDNEFLVYPGLIYRRIFQEVSDVPIH
jgi:hypothetical protein